MQELEKRIGLLRLLLADIIGKQAQLGEMEKQYRAQLERVVEFVVYREGDVANALSLMSEVQSKLDEVMQTSIHLEMIATKATTELDVLVLTKRVADARSQLLHLEERQRELSSRVSTFSASEIDAEPQHKLDSQQVEDIRSINDEVAEVESEIARLHSLITEASERAAHTIHAGNRTEQSARREQQQA